MEICGLLWVTSFVIFDLSLLFPVRPMLGHMMLFALMPFGDLNQAHVGDAIGPSVKRAYRTGSLYTEGLISKRKISS